MIWAWLLCVAGVLLFYQLLQRKKVDKQVFFSGLSDLPKAANASHHEQRAVAVHVLAYSRLRAWWHLQSELVELRLGHHYQWKALLLCLLLASVGAWFSRRWLGGDHMWVFCLVMVILGLATWWGWMTKRRKTEFENSFPDALNMMMSAVTAGESLIYSMAYVGDFVNNSVGRELAHVAERLRMGEAYNDVFTRSLRRFPYPSYRFFIISVKANFSRGGELKPLMQRLIRVLVESRSMERKKYALTSEARLSAKIVASFPAIFFVIMHFIAPENADFVLHDPAGRKILWYVLGSEFIGLSIIWWLVRGVKL